MSNVNVKITATEVRVTSPYNTDMVDEARLLGGKFDREEKAWCFDLRQEAAVRQTLKDIYGTDGTPTKTVDAYVTVISELCSEKGSIILGGREVARAWGRDSGAKPGEGVVFEKGRPASGGSVKNWKTILREGTKFVIQDIPQMAVDQFSELSELKIETLPSNNQDSARADQIRAEIARLQAELVKLEGGV